MNHSEEKMKLNDAIQEFLDGSGIGRYKDEAHMRSNLAAKLREGGFDVEEEKEVTMADGSILRPDLIVHVGEEDIPIELKYDNTSIEEYKEDEIKCQRYVEDLGNVKTAFCIFVSNTNHEEYGDWNECIGDKQYSQMWEVFRSDAFKF